MTPADGELEGVCEDEGVMLAVMEGVGVIRLRPSEKTGRSCTNRGRTAGMGAGQVPASGRPSTSHCTTRGGSAERRRPAMVSGLGTSCVTLLNSAQPPEKAPPNGAIHVK